MHATTTSTSWMSRLAGWSQRHHWLALAFWLVTLVGITATATAVGDDYRNDFTLPGTESQEVLDTLEAHAAGESGDSLTVVLQHPEGIAAADDRIAELTTRLEGLPQVVSVSPPAAEQGSVSHDGTIGFAAVGLDGAPGEVPSEEISEIIDAAQEYAGDGLRVELTGDSVREVAESEAGGGGAEGAGILAALVILLLMFGSLLAAAMPLITAVFAVGSAMMLAILASHLATIPDYTAPIMALVGLGVGIDYALLIFSRYRGELLAGADREAAGRTALDTAGRSVLLAGITVVIALLGLLILGLGALQGIALAVSLTVLMTMLASLTLLPALLTLFGRRIERRVRKHAAKYRREPGAGWRRLAALVQRSPWPALVAAVGVLVLLAVPALGMRLGFADAGNDHEDTTSRQAYDLLADGFGPGFNGPLVVVIDGSAEDAVAAQAALTDTSGVAAVTPAQPSPDGEVFTSLVFPASSPQDEATSDLVHALRGDVLPAVADESGATYLVGGSTAAAIDFSTAVADRFPWFIAVVVGLSAFLLMAALRSVLVPLKAAVLNLLSIGASLGVVTLVFQEGWTGFAEPGPIEAFVPVMIFAIVFGLSMDYEVFLVARMHEEWRHTGDAARAVREGLATTGSVITAAGAVMIVVFGAFLLAPNRMLQMFGLGLAIAVLLDAVVIRCLVVPAVMRLLGEHAWWLPRWLDRVLPRIGLEPQSQPGVVAATAGSRGGDR